MSVPPGGSGKLQKAHHRTCRGLRLQSIAAAATHLAHPTAEMSRRVTSARLQPGQDLQRIPFRGSRAYLPRRSSHCTDDSDPCLKKYSLTALCSAHPSFYECKGLSSCGHAVMSPKHLFVGWCSHLRLKMSCTPQLPWGFVVSPVQPKEGSNLRHTSCQGSQKQRHCPESRSAG